MHCFYVTYMTFFFTSSMRRAVGLLFLLVLLSTTASAAQKEQRSDFLARQLQREEDERQTEAYLRLLKSQSRVKAEEKSGKKQTGQKTPFASVFKDRGPRGKYCAGGNMILSGDLVFSPGVGLVNVTARAFGQALECPNEPYQYDRTTKDIQVPGTAVEGNCLGRVFTMTGLQPQLTYISEDDEIDLAVGSWDAAHFEPCN